MANRKETLTCSCDFSGVRPAVMDLPYPPIRVRERNPVYVLRTRLSRSVADIPPQQTDQSPQHLHVCHLRDRHPQKGLAHRASAGCHVPERVDEMLRADLERELAVIDQYSMHIRMIKDDYVNDVLKRIVQDEQYHVMLLRSMMDTM